MKRIAMVLLSFLLAACATAGREVTQNQAAEFKKGVTVVADVVDRLGPPTSSTTSSDGRKVLTYSFMHTQARPASFIPIVGAFVGGADSRISMATFQFDKNGKLEDYTASQTEVGSGFGLASGHYQTQPDSSQQPVEAK